MRRVGLVGVEVGLRRCSPPALAANIALRSCAANLVTQGRV